MWWSACPPFPGFGMPPECLKRPFASEKSARANLRKVKKMRGRRHQHQGKVERRVYQCPICRNWHLTSAPYED